MRIALLAPLPPEKNGIADYASHFRNALQGLGIEVATPLAGVAADSANIASRLDSVDWNGFDLVHAELGGGRLGEFIALRELRKRFPRLPLSATVHDPERMVWRRERLPWPLNLLERLPSPLPQAAVVLADPLTLREERAVAQGLTRLVTLTGLGGECLARRMRLPPGRVEVINHGNLEIATVPLPSLDTLRLLYFGFIYRGKGIEDLLEALADLFASAPEMRQRVRLTLAGGTAAEMAFGAGGNYLDQLKAQIAELGLADAIDWNLNLAAADIPRTIQAHHVMVLPYRESKKLGLLGQQRGTSGALSWAAACGRGAITSDARAFAEEVASGNGAIYPQGDVAALSEQLLNLAREPRLAQAWAERAERSAMRGPGRAPRCASRHCSTTWWEPFMARKGLYLGGSALLLAVVLLLVFWGRPADAEIQVLKAPRAVVWKDFLGVNAQFLWFSPERYNKQIDRLQDLGLEWVRLDLHWDRLETAEDQYQLASLDQLVKDLEARQLKSVFYLVGSARFITTAPFYSPFQDQYPPRDPEVFARRMAMLSQRYPSVAAWQVWNEPNLIGFWRPKADPEGYAKLLQASTIALRMVDPEKPVVSAGMAFFSEMPDGRTMFDALGHLGVESLGTIATYHPYTQLPEGNYPWNLDFVSHANQINRALRNAGVPAIWSTEWGWSAYKGPKELQDIIGVEGQADYVLRRLALMSALDYDRIFLFTLSDLDQRASVRDRDYGLLDLDANPKPVYLALQRFLKVTGPKLRPADPPVTEDLPDGSFSIGWTREDGRNVWLFWSARGGNVRLPKLKEATLHDPLSGKVTPLSGSDGLEVPVKSSLQMLVWE